MTVQIFILTKVPIAAPAILVVFQHFLLCLLPSSGEELFFQYKGDMQVGVLEQGKKHFITIPEGHMLLMPARIPHSPQRPAGTLGLVIGQTATALVVSFGLAFHSH